MKHSGAVLVLSLLASCATEPPAPPGTAGQPAPAGIAVAEADLPGLTGVGRAGPDGGPLVPAPHVPLGQVSAPSVSDRGIGGTGAPASAQTADRGIGGTGIVGVVTGFGSIFVDGIEVQYDDSALVDIDGSRSPVAALRAGQLVALQTVGPLSAPRATAISVQSAVTGRIEALELGSGTLTIAGQAVSVPAGTWGANRFGLGDWVKVSGLRQADGTIVASRLDAAPAGVLQARGQIVRDGGATRVGALVLSAAQAASVQEGQFVVVSGRYAGGGGQVSSVKPDTLFPNPAAFFGSSADHLIVQAFVAVNKGSLSMNGVQVGAEPVVAGRTHQSGIAIVSLERGPAGAFVAVGLRYADYHGHTGLPLRGGSGAGTGDTSQAPLRTGRTQVAAVPPIYGSDSGTAANGQVAASAVGGDPGPAASPGAVAPPPPAPQVDAVSASPATSAASAQPTETPATGASGTGASGTGASGTGVSSTGTSGGGTSNTGTSIAGTSSTGTSNTGTSIAGTSSTGTPGTGTSGTGTSGGGTSNTGTSIAGASSTGASSTGTSSAGASSAGMSTTGTSSVGTSSTGTPGTGTSSTGTSTTGTASTGTSGAGTSGAGTGTGAAVIESVPPAGGSTGQLISSSGGSGPAAASSVSPSGLHALTTVGAASAFGPSSVSGSSSSATVELLTGAVTSNTATNTGASSSQAIKASSSAAATKKTTPIGTGSRAHAPSSGPAKR